MKIFRSFLFTAIFGACLTPLAAPVTPETSLVGKRSVMPIAPPPPVPNGLIPLDPQSRPLRPLNRGLATGDFNGDGKLDLVVAPTYSKWQPNLPIQIWLNHGDGTFRNGTAEVIEGVVPSTGIANNIFVRDFNGDGRHDILIIDQGLEDKDFANPGFDGGLNLLLLSEPSGRLQDRTATSFPGQTKAFNHVSSIGDVDGDGDLDIVVTRLYGVRSGPGGISFQLNDGQGVFRHSVERLPVEIAQDAPQIPMTNYHFPGANATADLDGDGRLDLVTASYFGHDSMTQHRTVRVFRQGAGGAFSEAWREQIPSAIRNIGMREGTTADVSGLGLGASGIYSADLNSDGRLDLVVIWEGEGSSYLHFLRNDGNLQFTDVTMEWFGKYDATLRPPGSTAVGRLELRDLNGDGTPDLMMRHFGRVYYPEIAQSQSFFLNDGTGKLTPWTWRQGGAQVTALQAQQAMQAACGCDGGTMLLADVDGDAVDDLVVIDNQGANMNSATPSLQQSLTVVTFRSTSSGSPASSVADLWWAGSTENGWGLSLTQHRDTLFVVFYVYDQAGNPVWYVMPGGTWNAAHTAYTGAIYFPRGSHFGSYSASAFVVGASVGSATITFSANNAARVTYTINGQSGTKDITRQPLASGSPLVRYGDLWWGGAAENGWGLTLAQQANTLFGVWYTYDAAGTPRWYVIPGGSWSHNKYTGRAYATRSSPWLGGPYMASLFGVTDVGSVTLTFLDENSALFRYDVSGVTQTKPLRRQAF